MEQVSILNFSRECEQEVEKLSAQVQALAAYSNFVEAMCHVVGDRDNSLYNRPDLILVECIDNTIHVTVARDNLLEHVCTYLASLGFRLQPSDNVRIGYFRKDKFQEFRQAYKGQHTFDVIVKYEEGKS